MCPFSELAQSLQTLQNIVLVQAEALEEQRGDVTRLQTQLDAGIERARAAADLHARDQQRHAQLLQEADQRCVL